MNFNLKNKIIYLSAGLIFMATYFISCKALDVEKEFYLEHTFDILGADKNFNMDYLMDATSESNEFKDYVDLIKSIEVQDISYEITYHNGSETQRIDLATLTYADANGIEPETIVTLTDLNLASSVGKIVEQLDGQGPVELIQNEPHAFLINLTGSTNETPLDFKMKVKFKVKMIANPL